MDVRLPPLKIKTMIEANPLKTRILVPRLAVLKIDAPAPRCQANAYSMSQAACTEFDDQSKQMLALSSMLRAIARRGLAVHASYDGLTNI